MKLQFGAVSLLSVTAVLFSVLAPKSQAFEITTLVTVYPMVLTSAGVNWSVVMSKVTSMGHFSQASEVCPAAMTDAIVFLGSEKEKIESLALETCSENFRQAFSLEKESDREVVQQMIEALGSPIESTDSISDRIAKNPESTLIESNQFQSKISVSSAK